MNPEVKTAWVAALRSGDYAQGQGALRHFDRSPTPHMPDRFCCLGVLCEVASQEGLAVERYLPSPGTDYYYYAVNDGAQSMGGLPLELCAWAGLTHTEVDRLIKLNDAGNSFDVIAAEIERTL